MLQIRRKWLLLGIGAPVAGLLARWIEPNADAREAVSQEEIEKLFLARRASSRLCEVHAVPLLPDRVEIQYGIQYWDERAHANYPNARFWVEGGCMIPESGVGTLTYVLHCPTCRSRKGQLERPSRQRHHFSGPPIA